MNYKSTRGGQKGLLSSEAIRKGIAADGGLFVPETDVKLTLQQIEEMADMSYQERAVTVLKQFIDDYTDTEIRDSVYSAYTGDKFDDEQITPIYKMNDSVYVLELWHGPTCAFKDMALQILPHLLTKAVRKSGEKDEMVILVATSGDTGKAALEGFKDVEGTKIIVFYPDNGVSEVQKMQMVTQEGENVYSIAVHGNFDDAQNGVKAIFADSELNKSMADKGCRFSSANSINWGRLVPQIVYYVSAYAEMIKRGDVSSGDKINFVVPTGNFGNILAAYYAREMGVPINKLICASNDNNVLTDFINTGTYDRRREFKKTMSPSMDILISSNLERLLFELTGHNAVLIGEWMGRLKEDGAYTVDDATKNKISDIFWAEYSNDVETLKTIRCIYKDCNYVIDTHTAVAVDVYDKYVISTGDMTKTVIISTASPFKFNTSVAQAVLPAESVEGKSEFELLGLLAQQCKLQVPSALRDLEKKKVRHKAICSKSDMKEQVKKILEI